MNRLLLVSSIYPPQVGGPATYVAELARRLKQKGLLVTVLGNKLWLSLAWQLLKKGKSFDVFYLHGGLSVTLPAVVIGCFLRKKIVIKVTGDYAWEQARYWYWTEDDIDDFQKRKYFFLIEFLKKVQNWVLRRADKIVVPSQYLKKMTAGWGVPEKKIYVIYNATTSQVVRTTPQVVKIVFSAGRLVTWKGFDCLIRAFSRLHKKFPDFKLCIAGDGPMRPELDKLIKESGSQESIAILGNLNQDQMKEYYSKACCFVLFSGYEGLAHVLLEALSFSLPVIASAKGGNPELISDGVNGWLVAWPNEDLLHDCLLSFLKKVSGGQSVFAKPGLINPEKFSWDQNISHTIEILFS